jgi:hypothetical protein
MPAHTDYFVVLFGGQGSTSIFSATAAATAEEDAQSTSRGSILLSIRHAEFLEEIASLDTESQLLLAINTALFTSPRDLLKPTIQYHTHPVLQATTIYLYQLLHYLAESQRADGYGPFENLFDRLQETSGFSSGLIPAAIVASSPSLDDFVAFGIQGFRLAFWIACRTFLWDLKTNASVDEGADSEVTSSLVIRGLSPDQVEERLLQHFASQTSSHGIAQTQKLQISAISSSNVVSISGPRANLSVFREQALFDLATTFAHVHGWYHGGDQLKDVVQEVFEDLRRREVSFPACSTAPKPIRSTLDGTLFCGSKNHTSELLEWLVRHLLVHRVDWCTTAREIATNVRSLLEGKTATIVTLLSFGPSSGSLFPEFIPLDLGVELVDLSSLKASRKSWMSSDHQNSIAIAGLSVNLPKGKGTGELWETLSQGLNAVQEIPESRFKVSDYYSEDASHKPRSMPTNHGAFLDDPFS